MVLGHIAYTNFFFPWHFLYSLSPPFFLPWNSHTSSSIPKRCVSFHWTTNQPTMRGGQSYVSCPPSFSNDANRLLVGCGTSVAIFSTATALQVSSLEGHTSTVTSVVVVPGSNILNYCWTSSLDGTIRHWDFSLLECIKKIDLNLPIFSMVLTLPFSIQLSYSLL
jgi:WD40 repeat protein